MWSSWLRNWQKLAKTFKNVKKSYLLYFFGLLLMWWSFFLEKCFESKAFACQFNQCAGTSRESMCDEQKKKARRANRWTSLCGGLKVYRKSLDLFVISNISLPTKQPIVWSLVSIVIAPPVREATWRLRCDLLQLRLNDYRPRFKTGAKQADAIALNLWNFTRTLLQTWNLEPQQLHILLLCPVWCMYFRV